MEKLCIKYVVGREHVLPDKIAIELKVRFTNDRLQEWHGKRCHTGHTEETSCVLMIKKNIQTIYQESDLNNFSILDLQKRFNVLKNLVKRDKEKNKKKSNSLTLFEWTKYYEDSFLNFFLCPFTEDFPR